MKLIKIFLVSFIVFDSSLLIAQDIIYKQDGSVINGKIVEIGIDNIIYSNASNLEIEIKKVDVLKLVYQNGKEEIINFTSTPAQKVVEEPTKPIKTKPIEIEKTKKARVSFDSPKTLYLALHLGGAIPLGDIADNTLNNIKSGYATTGFNINFEVGYYVMKNFAVGAKFFSMANNRDANKIADDIKNQYTLISGNDVTTSATAHPFAFSGALLGIKGCLPIKRFSAELGLWTGYASTNLGELNKEYFFKDTDYYDYTYPALSSSGLGLGIDLSLKFDISKYLFLAGQFEYLTHKAAYNSYTYFEYESLTTSTYYYNAPAQSINISTANISLGVGFVFRKKNK